jgi:uncharacterized phage-associated protein
MPYDAKSLANYFLDIANENRQSIDPMKLQKLVYYACGWYAGHTGEPLIDEAIEAWPYGPVIPSLYHEFKRFGAGVIVAKATEFDGMQFRQVAPPAEPHIRQFLSNIWTSYGGYTGTQLSEFTHATDGPWWATMQASGGTRGADIPFPLIAQHFGEAVQRANQRQAAQ